MDSISIAVEDFDAYCVDTLNEGAALMKNHDALSMESWSTTSMTSISTEGLIDWVKDKLKKIGHKFVIVVNKIVARFSKNREKLERNIEIYRKNPDAKVQLAVSPKTLAMICGTIAAISAAIVAVILCIPKKDGKQTMERVEQQVDEKVEQTKKQVESDKKVIEEAAKDPAKAEKVQVDAKQAEANAKKMIEVQAKSEAELKKITNKVTGLDPQGGDKTAGTNLISNATKGCSTAMHMAQTSTQLADITAKEPVMNREVKRKASAQERREQNRKENAARRERINPTEKTEKEDNTQNINQIDSLRVELRAAKNWSVSVRGAANEAELEKQWKMTKNNIIPKVESLLLKLSRTGTKAELAQAKQAYNNVIQQLNAAKAKIEKKAK